MAIYALANQKGGVGKTTTAINVAACLAEAGESTLLIDLDPQANATSGLGERANGVSSFDLLDGAPVDQLAAPTRFANLELIPARPDLAGAAASLALRDDGERYLAAALRPPASRHPSALPDSPPPPLPLPLRIPGLPAPARPADRQRAGGCRPGPRPGPGRVLRARGGSADPELDRSRSRPAQSEADTRRPPADDGRRPHPACCGRIRGARPALRFARVQDPRPAIGSHCRGAELRAPRDRVRPTLGRRRCVLEGGDGACRAQLIRRRPAAGASAAGSKCF